MTTESHLRILSLIPVQFYKASAILVLCDCQNLAILLSGSFKHPWYTTYVSFGGIPALANPYGILWWLFFLPGSYSLTTSILYLTMVDTIVAVLVSRRVSFKWFYAYIIFSLLFFIQSPVDMPVFWLLALGTVYTAWLSAVAIIVKLPVGAPMFVWAYIFAHPLGQAVLNSNTWRYYMFAGWFFLTVILQIRKRFFQGLYGCIDICRGKDCELSKEELERLKKQLQEEEAKAKLQAEIADIIHRLEERQSSANHQLKRWLKETGYWNSFLLGIVGIVLFEIGLAIIAFPLQAIGGLMIVGAFLFTPFLRPVWDNKYKPPGSGK